MERHMSGNIDSALMGECPAVVIYPEDSNAIAVIRLFLILPCVHIDAYRQSGDRCRKRFKKEVLCPLFFVISILVFLEEFLLNVTGYRLVVGKLHREGCGT